MSIHQQANVRCTFDLPESMHRYLKIICAEDNEPMNAFVAKALSREFSEREERIDAEAFDSGMKDIKEHGTISMEEMDGAMGV